MGMFYSKEQIFSMCATWEYISTNNWKVKCQVEAGADSSVISSKIWTEFGKPQLNGKISHLEAYDSHQLTLLGSLTCDVERNGSRRTQKQLAVKPSDKEFGLLRRDPSTQARCEQHQSRTRTFCEELQSSCEADTRINANFL